MKKLGLLLLLASSSAMAGGAGQPLNNQDFTLKYIDTVLNYAKRNSNHLPVLTNCIQGKYPDIIKPDQLKLNSCGIYRKFGKVYIEVSGNEAGALTSLNALPTNTPQKDATEDLQTLVALYEMRYKLHQSAPKNCDYVPSDYCHVKREGNKFKIYFESTKGIRLYYDGKKIQDWPKGAEAKALSQFQNTLSAYIWANKSSLPNLVDCLTLNDGSYEKPAPLILGVCGIYKSNGRTYLDIATKSGMGIFTLVDGTLAAETPKQDAVAQMTVAIEQYNMRRLLGQPAITICSSAYLSGTYCRAKTEDGKVKSIYFESEDGIRLMYDGQVIKDWPKE